MTPGSLQSSVLVSAREQVQQLFKARSPPQATSRPAEEGASAAASEGLNMSPSSASLKVRPARSLGTSVRGLSVPSSPLTRAQRASWQQRRPDAWMLTPSLALACQGSRMRDRNRGVCSLKQSANGIAGLRAFAHALYVAMHGPRFTVHGGSRTLEP